MHDLTREEELDGFKYYEKFLKSCNRVDTNKVVFVTLEGSKHTVELSNAGWALSALDCNDDPASLSQSQAQAPHRNQQQHYETVEALLMTLSPQFRSEWNKCLAARLWEYANEDQQEAADE